MFPLQLDGRLLSPRGAVEKGLALVPILIALATGAVALLQVVNGLPTETTIETLVFGWLLAAPAAALVLWPLPTAVPVPSLGKTSRQQTEGDDALQRLRDRYAAGEVDQAEFERRLEHLLATEDQHDANAATVGPSSRPDEESDPVAESE